MVFLPFRRHIPYLYTMGLLAGLYAHILYNVLYVIINDSFVGTMGDRKCERCCIICLRHYNQINRWENVLAYSVFFFFHETRWMLWRVYVWRYFEWMHWYVCNWSAYKITYDGYRRFLRNYLVNLNLGLFLNIPEKKSNNLT